MIVYYKSNGLIVSVQSEPVSDVFNAYQSINLELSENELANIATYRVVNGELVQSTELIEQYQKVKLANAAIESERRKKDAIRSDIAQTAGDSLSLLGTTSDVALLLLFEVAKMAQDIHSATSLEDVKEAAKPINDLFNSLVMKVNNGEVKLPYLEKGIDVVMNEIEQRSTLVTDALIANK
ncbi:hypothetical protein [Vibrio sp. MEBiC08052]|uniref:hypothetical protein n=1 Tax=Vibrio sp. MEBiC08052 TaxID=1761910 RepID=UPI0007406610|nr:hypothetical protein [Vibrio sp. MEBiC08052]KUI98984.1 hypothetical protein VRK_17580 [Vibrio sp. MEBiC08052]